MPAWLKPVLSSIRAALGDVWDVPLRPFQAETAALPPAADYKGGIAYDASQAKLAYSNGAAWLTVIDTSAAAFTGNFSCNGNATIGDGTSDNHTINGLVAIAAANATSGSDTSFPLRLTSGGNSALALGFDADEAFIQSWGSRTLRINQQGNTVALVADKHVFSSGGYNLGTGLAVSINGAQVVTSRRTGWSVPTGTAARTTFDTATVTTGQLAERVKALIDDLTTHGLIGA